MNSELIRQGPRDTGSENLPLKEFNKSCPIVAFVIDLKNNDEIIDAVRLDYGNYEHRKYLGKLSFFCFSKGYSLETMSELSAEGRY